MISLKSGLAALAIAQGALAYADPSSPELNAPARADVWIGFANSENGFLLDEQSGAVWMTGACLKPLEPAQALGPVWTSRTVELVSVGPGKAPLEQIFRLDSTPGAARISVTSTALGRDADFDAVLDRNCVSGGMCARLIASQQVCQD